MAYNHFDYVPSTVDVRRSVFKYKQQRVASCYIGYLYPAVKPIKMMPGSSISLDLASEIRSGALIAPLCSELNCDWFAFFVPNRIVWEHWKQFLGAVDDVTFNNLSQYTIPSFPFGIQSVFRNGGNNNSKLNWFWNQMVACHFGIQCPTNGQDFVGDLTKPTKAPQLNALQFRGYTFCWNTYFRPEQIVAPLVIGKTDNGYDGDNMDSYPGSYIYSTANEVEAYAGQASKMLTGGSILPVYRVNKSIYTSCLPNPSLETLNLLAGLQAPVGVISSSTQTTSSLGNYPAIASGVSLVDGKFSPYVGTTGMNNAPVVADLNQALLTVNNYRETIMLQNYYDALNRAGSRYDEIIRNIFHVNTSAALVDIPQLIIHKRYVIYRKEVVSQSNVYDGEQSYFEQLGTQGAYIDTVVKDDLLTFSSVEHGYLHIMYAVRNARLTMSSGIDPDFRQLEKFDLYYPQFDGMGDVSEDKISVYYDFTRDNDDPLNKAILGYQEYGAHYKWQRNDAVGFVDPHTNGHIKGYVITDTYNTAPTLNGWFVSGLADFVAFANCLAISSPLVSPHFIIDIRLEGTITHPMPTYNIPGQGALL